jgi:hypothetical protein
MTDDPTEPRVLATCEALHMLHTGACDLPTDEAKRLYHWLSARVAGWSAAPERSRVYDSIVYTLAAQALVDFEDWWQHIGAPAEARKP